MTDIIRKMHNAEIALYMVFKYKQFSVLDLVFEKFGDLTHRLLESALKSNESESIEYVKEHYPESTFESDVFEWYFDDDAIISDIDMNNLDVLMYLLENVIDLKLSDWVNLFAIEVGLHEDFVKKDYCDFYIFTLTCNVKKIVRMVDMYMCSAMDQMKCYTRNRTYSSLLWLDASDGFMEYVGDRITVLMKKKIITMDHVSKHAENGNHLMLKCMMKCKRLPVNFLEDAIVNCPLDFIKQSFVDGYRLNRQCFINSIASEDLDKVVFAYENRSWKSKITNNMMSLIVGNSTFDITMYILSLGTIPNDNVISAMTDEIVTELLKKSTKISKKIVLYHLSNLDYLIDCKYKFVYMDFKHVTMTPDVFEKMSRNTCVPYEKISKFSP